MKARELADSIVKYCKAEKLLISNLQLQKILYFIELNSLKNRDSLVCDDDLFEAWKFGPVVPSVYRAYALSGGMPIFFMPKDASFSEEVKPWVFNLVKDALQRSPWYLVELSHTAGGAWDKAYRKTPRSKISKEDMIYDSNFIHSELITNKYE